MDQLKEEMKTVKNMNESTNICLSCGICCDGTLIGFVQLDQKEIPEIRAIMDIEEENGQGLFLHPCKKYCDGCMVYSRRPKQCASFECGLLKSVEKRELAFNSAVEIINVVKQKKIVIEEKLKVFQIELQSRSFYFKMVELEKILQQEKADSLLTPNHRHLLLEIQHLDRLLLKNFGLSLF